MTAPAVFALPPGADFATQFARGYHARFAGLEFADRAHATVLVNTGLALTRIQGALADEAPGPGLLPSVRHIDDLANDLSAAPTIDPLRRQLYLTRLVERFLTRRAAADAIAPTTSTAADLAQSLAELLDQFHTHGVSPDRLTGIEVEGEAAKHWQEALSFVDLVRTAWPAIRAEDEDGAMDAAAVRALAIETQIACWAEDAPPHPVIAAASTGSVGTTAALMAAIAQLPQGVVVLPGFDPGVEPAIWQAATPDHPMGPFQDFFGRLEIRPDQVELWQPVGPGPRRALIEQAMRPAPVTDHWHQSKDSLAEGATDALRGLNLLEADSPRQEAAAIAVAIREALAEPGIRVTVITNDGALARRVTAALDRFGIIPDDTIGAPLAQSVPGVLAGLTLAAAAPGASTLDMAALLQHPLVRPGRLRSLHLSLARSYEKRVLRRIHARGLLPPDPNGTPDSSAWLTTLNAILDPLRHALAEGAALADGAGALRAALVALTDPGDGPAVWEGDEGAALQQFFADLERHAEALGDQPVGDLPALVTALMRGRQIRPRPREPHPRVRIVGTREARVESVDRLILAGLNDGSWPQPADPGPWLSRPMHSAAGLPLPERAVGLSAHDFQHAICCERVLLTRSVRAEGAPTVASRWLVRLETLMNGIGAAGAWKQVKKRGARYADLARRLDQPDTVTPRAERPAPIPPTCAIPRQLPVTQIETLIRDAYAVYARYVLGLRPLDPLGRRADMRERGQLLHDVMEAWVQETVPWPGADAARDALMDVADRALVAQGLPADLRRAWRGRIGRFADWLITQEEHRRANATPIAWEKEGTIILSVAGEAFTLTARADRIDRLSDGQGALYDYKSGRPPTEKQIREGFNQQLHLAGLILARGGFPDVPAMIPAIGAFIGLTGGREGGLETFRAGLADDLDGYRENLVKLLAAYLAGAPWVSRGRPERIAFASDYDHLARAAEWSREDQP